MMLLFSSSLSSTQQEVVDALKGVYDPELPVNIYDLGLIYDIVIGPSGKNVDIVMTLTTPSCPAAELLPKLVKEAVVQVPWVEEAEVHLTFDPPYTPDRMAEDARIALGWE